MTQIKLGMIEVKMKLMKFSKGSKMPFIVKQVVNRECIIALKGMAWPGGKKPNSVQTRITRW
jgi:hypothetical protein